MLRCTCCGHWTVEVITDLDRGRGAGRQTVYRVRHHGYPTDYTTWAAAERELIEQGVLEYLVEDEEPDAA